MNKKAFDKDIKTIKFTFDHYWNGWHLDPKEWAEFEQAVDRINKLKQIVAEEVGVI